MPEQKVISVDSQWLNMIQSCFYKTKLVFIDCMQPPEKAEPLERGSLMHDMLEVFYELKGPRKFETTIWRDLSTAGLYFNNNNAGLTFNFEASVNFAKQVAYWRASQQDLSGDIVDETIYQFNEYCNHYRNDPWTPLAVEEVGSRILYEDESLKIIYNFKIDMVASNGSITAPWDHKTGSRRHTPTSLSNQFIGYCFGLGLNTIVINKIGFQKTLKPSERFERFPLTISNQRITEWVKNSVWWIMLWDSSHTAGEYPRDFTSCDKYSGCMYQRICESDPESREWKLDRDFKKGPLWDVAKELEPKL